MSLLVDPVKGILIVTFLYIHLHLGKINYVASDTWGRLQRLQYAIWEN